LFSTTLSLSYFLQPIQNFLLCLFPSRTNFFILLVLYSGSIVPFSASNPSRFSSLWEWTFGNGAVVHVYANVSIIVNFNSFSTKREREQSATSSKNFPLFTHNMSLGSLLRQISWKNNYYCCRWDHYLCKNASKVKELNLTRFPFLCWSLESRKKFIDRTGLVLMITQSQVKGWVRSLPFSLYPLYTFSLGNKKVRDSNILWPFVNVSTQHFLFFLKTWN
jgi:hypothetical protein